MPITIDSRVKKYYIHNLVNLQFYELALYACTKCTIVFTQHTSFYIQLLQYIKKNCGRLENMGEGEGGVRDDHNMRL
jgi:hypothetical protein